jgi:integrase
MNRKGTMSSKSTMLLSTYLCDWLEKRKSVFDAEGNPIQIGDGFADEYEKQISRLRGVTELAPSTYASYRSTLYRHILPRLPKTLRLLDARRSHFETLLARCAAEGVGKRTLEVIRNLLHKTFDDAIVANLVAENPVFRLTVAYHPGERAVPDRDGLFRFLQIAERSRFGPLFYLATATTFRKSELLGLRWADYDAVNKTITVRGQIQRIPINGKQKTKGDLTIGSGTALIFRAETKTDDSKRTIPLGSYSIKILEEQKQVVALQRELAKRSGKPWAELDLVFPTSKGTPIEAKTVQRAFKKALREAGLDAGVHFHDLRHTGITYVQSPEVGANIKTAKKRSGHKRDEMLARYTHTTDELDRDAAEKLDQLLSTAFKNRNDDLQDRFQQA